MLPLPVVFPFRVGWRCCLVCVGHGDLLPRMRDACVVFECRLIGGFFTACRCKITSLIIYAPYRRSLRPRGLPWLPFLLRLPLWWVGGAFGWVGAMVAPCRACGVPLTTWPLDDGLPPPACSQPVRAERGSGGGPEPPGVAGEVSCPAAHAGYGLPVDWMADGR